MINTNISKVKLKHIMPSFLSASLGILSHTLIIFCNRIFLSHYSLDVMNAVSTISLIYVTLVFASMHLVSIAEVFIGQYNGAKQYKHIGSVIWQVTYLCIFVWGCILLPIALYGYQFLVPDIVIEHGLDFLQIMIIGCGITMPLIGVAMSFFMGIGQPKIIVIASLIGNIITIILDVILIFGIDGYLDAMGGKGSAIATVIGSAVSVLILFGVVFSKKNISKYRMFNMKLDITLSMQCLKTGIPSAITHILETAAFAFIIYKITYLGSMHLTVNNIINGIFILLIALPDGVYKASMPFVSNLIGAQKHNLIFSAMMAFARIICIVILPVGILCTIYFDTIVSLFLATLNNNIEYITISSHALIGCIGMYVYIFFYSVLWLIFGVMSAGGDTRFVAIANTACLWLIVVVPFIFLLDYVDLYPSLLWVTLYPAYAIITTIIACVRYKSGKWKKIDINQLS